MKKIALVLVALAAVSTVTVSTAAFAGSLGDCGCSETPQKKHKGNNGFGNGPNDGIPGNSEKTGKTDEDR